MSENDPSDVPYKNIWKLRTDNMIEGHSWHWWWWIFFIKNPENPMRPKQLMILWSSKYTDRVKVDHKWWHMDKPPHYVGNNLKFNGMAAAWYFDGKNMQDPLVLREGDFTVTNSGKKGELDPKIEGTDYRFYGSKDEYRVNIQDDENDFKFRLTPWNSYLNKHRLNENKYFRGYNYNILKILGMKLDGAIDGKDIEGSAYFQRVSMNAPAMPWYWGIIHCEDGSFIQYFNPFIGPQIFRKGKKQRSLLDWGDISLSKSLLFYHRETDTEYKFRSKDIQIKHSISDELPSFVITGEDDEKRIKIELDAYSRALWRFEEPNKLRRNSVFHYNEYPAELTDFYFQDNSNEVEKDDLGRTYSNFEHSWGKLL